MSQRVELKKQTVKDLILQNYALSVSSLQKVRGIYKINAETGHYAFKNAEEITDLPFVNECVSHITKNGFQQLPQIVPAMSGDLPVSYQGQTYYLEQWVNAQEITKVPTDIECVGAALAKFHRAAAGLVPDRDSIRYGWGIRPRFLLHCYAKIEQWLHSACFASRTGFERQMLEFLKYRCWLAYLYIKDISYPKLVNAVPESAVLCHGSLHQKNILVDHEQNIWFVDIESLVYAERVLDVAQLLHYHAPSHEWNTTSIRELVRSYQSLQSPPLHRDEWKCLFSYLAFPRRLYNSMNDYFTNEEHSKKSYMKLKKIIEFDWSKETFLNKYNPTSL